MVTKVRGKKDKRSNILRFGITATADAVTQTQIDLPISLADGQAILIDAIAMGGYEPSDLNDASTGEYIYAIIASRDDLSATSYSLSSDGVFYYNGIERVSNATTTPGAIHVGMGDFVKYEEPIKPLVVNNDLTVNIALQTTGNQTLRFAIWYRIVKITTNDILEALEQSGNL